MQARQLSESGRKPPARGMKAFACASVLAAGIMAPASCCSADAAGKKLYLGWELPASVQNALPMDGLMKGAEYPRSAWMSIDLSSKTVEADFEGCGIRSLFRASLAGGKPSAERFDY
jgi:hypothetical protein